MKWWKVLNAMYVMKMNEKIDLENLHRKFRDNTTLYRGRPEMLKMRLDNGRNVQLFRNGTIQLLGNIPCQEATKMRNELLRRLRLVMKQCRATTWTLKNIVVTAQLKKAVCLQKIATSDYNLFYECELFPAALIKKWHPAHVTLFHNGRVVITGIKNEETLKNVFHSLSSFLTQTKLYL